MAAAPAPRRRRRCVAAKRAARARTISVCLPARNEEATVGQIVATVRRNLVERRAAGRRGRRDRRRLDRRHRRGRTAGRARACSPVDDVLPDLPAGRARATRSWMSLYACDGDIVCWLDADVRNFGAHFVTRLLEPLLTDPAIGFVKGYYRRPLLRRADRRRACHRAHGPAGDLGAVPAPRRLRAAARR